MKKFKTIITALGSALGAILFAIFHFKNKGKKEENKLYNDVKKSSEETIETINSAKKKVETANNANQSILDILEKYDI